MSKFTARFAAALTLVFLVGLGWFADAQLAHLSITDTIAADYLSLDVPEQPQTTAVSEAELSEVEEIVVDDWMQTARRSRRNRSRSF